jgi:glycerate dehydrogenase
MNVVVIDSARLAGEADFPMLDLPKFGWQQYPEADAAEVAERCWRADIIVSVATPINRTVIDKAFKLKLIAVAGESYEHIDLEAARERGIRVSNVPGLNPGDASATPQICTRVVENISAFLNGEESNLVE